MITEDKFSALCDLMSEELDRQELALRVCEAQNRALSARDVRALEQHTATLALLATEGTAINRKRASLVAEMTAAEGWEPQLPLRELAERSPEPWRCRLLWYRDRLRRTAGLLHYAMRGNSLVLRGAMRATEGTLRDIGLIVDAAGYTETGDECMAQCAAVGLLDQRG